MEIREEIAKIFGMGIAKNGIDQAFQKMNMLGRLDQRKLVDIIIMLCKKMEEIQTTNKK